MLEQLVDRQRAAFRLHADVLDDLQAACLANRDVAAYHRIGQSEEGRTLAGAVLGSGPLRVSIVAGAHADEPVGPETLRTLIVSGLRQRASLSALLEAVTFVVVPHVNPDGEARNRPWMRVWPDAGAYIQMTQREPPGRDVEFSYPDRRPENRVVAEFLRAHGPFDLHLSLHGMGFAEGGLLLVDRRWGYRVPGLMDDFRALLARYGLGLHDQNRRGEKGFFYLGPGFWTTPEGAAMRSFFEGAGDPDMAAKFGDSSMDFVRGLGGDPLCLVTELPLFVIPSNTDHRPGQADACTAFKALLPDMRARLDRRESIDDVLASFLVTPVDVGNAIAMQLSTIEMGIRAARAHRQASGVEATP